MHKIDLNWDWEHAREVKKKKAQEQTPLFSN